MNRFLFRAAAKFRSTAIGGGVTASPALTNWRKSALTSAVSVASAGVGMMWSSQSKRADCSAAASAPRPAPAAAAAAAAATGDIKTVSAVSYDSKSAVGHTNTTAPTAKPFKPLALPLRTNDAYEPFVHVMNVFTSAECDRIRALGLAIPSQTGVVTDLNTESTHSEGGDSFVPKQIRRARIAWLLPDEQTQWIYDRLQAAAMEVNDETYNFDLTTFGEPLQFTHYLSSENGHYSWHRDAGGGSSSTRKLSLVVQLSDPTEYDTDTPTSGKPTATGKGSTSGQLQLFDGVIINVPRAKGSVVFFPSYVVHRVTPVETGERFTLVAWLRGPPFR